MKVYKVTHAYRDVSPQIEEFEATKTSEKTIWFGQSNRVWRKSTYSQYFDTWAEAYSFLLDKQTDMVLKHREYLARSEETLNKIKKLRR